MQRIGEILPGSNNSYSNNNSNGGLYNKPTIAIAIIPLSSQEENRLIAWASDLIDPQYRLWFIKRLKVVGKQHFIESATAARKYDGESRQRVFAHLLK